MKRSNTKAVIVGSGMSGILTAITLLKEGVSDFTIIEKSDSPGGTWRDNRYPGLQCDVPAYMYTYSFEPNPDCSRRYAEGAELRAYFEGVFQKYNLAPNTLFNTKVTSATWIESESRWEVKTDTDKVLSADLFFCATGVLHNPQYPDIPGLNDFKGDMVHSARWDENLELKDKKVGIIGTGSTAVQIISTVADTVENLTVFQRSPHWVVPALDKPYANYKRRFLAKYPVFARALAIIFEKIYDNTAGEIGRSRIVAPALGLVAKFHLWKGVKDKELRRKLTPDYKPGCKRLIMSDDFYKAMSRDNVTLECESISHIDEKGVVTQDGHCHELDVLVLATGFKTDFCLSIDIAGEEGVKLADVWSESVYGYKSLMVPGFPNFFVLLGPHSPFGNFSFINVAESQLGYVKDLLTSCDFSPGKSIQPKSDVTRAFNKEMAGAVKGTIWASGCQSWYLDKDGNPMLWPWSFKQYRADMSKANSADYEVRNTAA